MSSDVTEPVTLTLEKIQRLEVRPDDVLLFTVSSSTSNEVVSRLLETLNEWLPDTKCLVVTPDTRVEVISQMTDEDEAVKVDDALRCAGVNWGALPEWLREEYEAGRIIFTDKFIEISVPGGFLHAESGMTIVKDKHGLRVEAS